MGFHKIWLLINTCIIKGIIIYIVVMMGMKTVPTKLSPEQEMLSHILKTIRKNIRQGVYNETQLMKLSETLNSINIS